MILRKPYAFFIKMFKPIHFALAALIAYLIVLENKIYSFLSSNMYNSNNFIGQNLDEKLGSSGLFAIPIVLIIFCVLILIVMFSRKKPFTFYLISIGCAIAILIINVNSVDFLKTLDETIVTLKSMKVIHDISLIAIIIETVLLVIMIIRGAGVNIKKFNFDSDLSKIDIKETDNEEFEVDIRFSLDETKRKKNKRIRYIKYVYEEKKLMVNCIILGVLFLIGIIIFAIIDSRDKVYREGIYTSNSRCSFSVKETYYTNKDSDGKVIVNDYSLIIVNISIRKNYDDARAYLNDFVLNIGNTLYSPTTEYNKYLTDIGNAFNEELDLEYKDYYIVYRVPKNSVKKKMIFRYNDGNKYTYIKLKPKNIDVEETLTNASIGEEIVFSGKLEGIKFNISEYDIKDSYTLNYNYCINKNDCVASKEYIKPKLNQNYDKSVIRLNIDYNNESDLKLSSFYDLLTTFGKIEYRIGNITKYQKNNIEKIVSSKKQENGIVYLGVNSEIKNAEEVYFIFNLRGTTYRYKVK